MFKFNFDLEDLGDDAEIVDLECTGSGVGLGKHEHPPNTVASIEEVPSAEIALDELIAALPPAISFSPLSIVLSTGQEICLSRRDLFDARFQMISDDTIDTKIGRSDIDFVDAPSDLVPGVYEGGLKTWECSLDLVEVLHSMYGRNLARNIRGKRILELGCGTAVPSLYILHSLFSEEPATAGDVDIHLQDYNGLVLRLVTLPNIILAWYCLMARSDTHDADRTRSAGTLCTKIPIGISMPCYSTPVTRASHESDHIDMSPASLPYRSAPESVAESATLDEEQDSDPLPPADAKQPGELPLTPALVAAFQESLQTYRLHLKLFKGAWTSFDVGRSGGLYDIVLTSETIYRPESLPSLVGLLKRATVSPDVRADADDGETSGVEHAASRLTLSDGDGGLKTLASLGAPCLCLVAAKLVYFGVGGGVNEFVGAVGKLSGRVQTVWERGQGVKRSVMRVVWDTI
ncbi:hypothetical protein C8Q80DRAFT_822566 [Daedaleopsis nitida]|nr:hypothetical protein C8Q80DRAFT_822566 [Daedaleopsis nitida]